MIFLTALEDEGNVVDGLQYGDDYVTKPFRTKELIARIYANTRKAGREKISCRYKRRRGHSMEDITMESFVLMRIR